MKSLTYHCPKCGLAAHFPESKAGLMIVCPQCQTACRLELPQANILLPALVPEPPPLPIRKNKRSKATENKTSTQNTLDELVKLIKQLIPYPVRIGIGAAVITLSMMCCGGGLLFRTLESNDTVDVERAAAEVMREHFIPVERVELVHEGGNWYCGFAYANQVRYAVEVTCDGRKVYVSWKYRGKINVGQNR